MIEVLPENGLQSSLSGSISPSTTTISIQTTDAPKWPATGEYRAVLWQDAVTGPWELVKVVSGQGTSTLGVLRAAEPYRGTQTALTWPSGTGIAAVLTQDGISALLQNSALTMQLQEFVPAGGATSITLSGLPEQVVMVARNGVVQSPGAFHYAVAGSVITFAAPFNGTDRAIVSYSVRGIPGWTNPAGILIQRIVVGTDVGAPVASVSFTGIPGSYQNLLLQVIAASNSTIGSYTDVQAIFNGDFGSTKYGYSSLYYTGGTTGAESLNAAAAVFGQVPTRAGANISTRPGTVHGTIFGYTSTVWQKQFLALGYVHAQDSGGFPQPRLAGGVWKDQSIITSIDLNPALGSWVSGSQFNLYGVP